MECFHYKGNMILSNAPFSADRNGYQVSWESVPAWVYIQCGEAFFEKNEIHHIQKSFQKIDDETLALISKVA